MVVVLDQDARRHLSNFLGFASPNKKHGSFCVIMLMSTGKTNGMRQLNTKHKTEREEKGALA